MWCDHVGHCGRLHTSTLDVAWCSHRLESLHVAKLAASFRERPPCDDSVVPPWIPNAISVIRVLLVPVWLVLAFQAREVALAGGVIDRTPLLGVFVALGLSDLVDGFIARRFHLESNLGATLDAVADKLAQVATVTFLVFLGAPGFASLPLWLWVTLLARDGALATGFLLVFRRHRAVHIEHRWHGKASSLVLFVVITLGIANVQETAILVGSFVSLALIVPSTVSYVREGLRQLSASERPAVRGGPPMKR
jgi:phosphatidylglycerophosphate synthase